MPVEVGGRKTRHAVIMLMIMMSTLINVLIPFPLTASGKLALTLYDAVSVFLCLFSLYRCYRDRKKLPSIIKKELLLAALLFLIIVVSYVYRFIVGYRGISSLVAIQATYLPLWVFAVVVMRDIDRLLIRKMLCVTHAMYIALFFIEFAIIRDLRTFTFTLNIFLCTIAGILPISFGILAEASDHKELRWYRFLAIFSIGASLAIPLITGIRAAAITFTAEFLLCAILLWRPSTAYILNVLVCVLLCFVVTMLFLWLNDQAKLLFYSRIATLFVSEEVSIKAAESRSIRIRGVIRSVIDVKEESDASRTLLWQKGIEEFMKSPILGTGNVSIVLEGVETKQTYHNFILDYINAYGAVGFVVWIAMYVVPVIPALRWWAQRPTKRTRTMLFRLVPFAGILAISFMQPTLFLTNITSTMWLLAAMLYMDTIQGTLQEKNA